MLLSELIIILSYTSANKPVLARSGMYANGVEVKYNINAVSDSPDMSLITLYHDPKRPFIDAGELLEILTSKDPRATVAYSRPKDSFLCFDEVVGIMADSESTYVLQLRTARTV